MSQLAVRLDPLTEAAFQRIVDTQGMSKSDAIRFAILAGDRELAAQRMRAESAALQANVEYIAEIAEVQKDLENLRAW
jgi:hypothetical protein